MQKDQTADKTSSFRYCDTEILSSGEFVISEQVINKT